VSSWANAKVTGDWCRRDVGRRMPCTSPRRGHGAPGPTHQALPYVVPTSIGVVDNAVLVEPCFGDIVPLVPGVVALGVGTFGSGDLARVDSRDPRFPHGTGATSDANLRGTDRRASRGVLVVHRQSAYTRAPVPGCRSP
jgi:hypothetical protein